MKDSDRRHEFHRNCFVCIGQFFLYKAKVDNCQYKP